MGYRTINIKPQETKTALVAELARVLGAELEWTVSGNNVVHESGMRFIFDAGSTNVSYGVGNGTVSNTSAVLGSFSTTENWILDIITSGSATAIGARTASTTAVKIATMIVENTAGGFTGIMSSSNSASIIKPTWASVKSANLTVNNSEGVATSLMLYPDIYGGCMFKDLYMVYSCPLSTTDKIMHVGGTSFRYIGVNGNYGFALAV